MGERAHGKEEVFRATLDGSGRIVIPAELRSVLGVAPGDALLIFRDESGIHVETPEQALTAMRRYFQSVIPPDVNLVDELIAERRAEAERD